MTFIILISCKTDPNKQVDEGTVEENVYHSKVVDMDVSGIKFFLIQTVTCSIN